MNKQYRGLAAAILAEAVKSAPMECVKAKAWKSESYDWLRSDESDIFFDEFNIDKEKAVEQIRLQMRDALKAKGVAVSKEEMYSPENTVPKPLPDLEEIEEDEEEMFFFENPSAGLLAFC